MSTRVILADAHCLLRQGIRAILEHEADVEIVGETDEGRTAIQLVSEYSPDVLLMDSVLPGLNGIDVTRLIRRDHSATKVLILSAQNDLPTLRECLKAGAHGYLLKECDRQELMLAIKTVMANDPYITPKATSFLVRDYLEGPSESPQGIFIVLTLREREIIQLISEGHSSQAISELLSIGRKTVDCHRQNAMRKLGFHCTADVVKYAIREGLTSLHEWS